MGATVSASTWEIHTFASGDYLHQVIQAIAAIFNSGQYQVAMQTVTIIAFLGLLLKSAFDRDMFFNIRWILAYLLFVFTAFSAKVNVTIHDHIQGEHHYTVNHVPFGVAFPISFFSSMGYWLTQMFETTFSLPNGLRYTQTGFLFSHQLLDLSRQATFSNERLHQNFSEFFSACVIVDGIGHDRFTWEQVMESQDLLSFFANHVAQHAASFKYKHASVSRHSNGDEVYYPCQSGFTRYLKPDIEANSVQTLSATIGQYVSPDQSHQMQTTLQHAMRYLTGVQQSPKTWITQNTLINATANSLMHFAQAVQSQTFIQHYTTLRAETERKTTYQAVGHIAKDKLPILKNMIESFLYAITPIIFLLALVSPFKVSLAYFKAMVWINLWPICYAIIHFAISYHSQQEMMSLANTHGLCATSHSKMGEYLAEWVSTSGYLISALPLIAWMILSGSGSLAASFSNRLMQGYDQAVSKASDEITKGEGQLAGHHWNMTQSGQIQTSHTNALGSKITHTASGTSFIEQMRSQSAVDLNLSESFMQSSKQEYASAQQYQQSQSIAMQQSTSAAFNDASTVMASLNASKGYSEQYQQAQSQQQQENERILDGYIDKWAQTQGYEYSNRKELTHDIKGSMAVGFGIANPLKNIIGVSFDAQGSAEKSQKDAQSHTHSDSFQRAQNFVSSQEYAQAITHIAGNTLQFGAQQGYSQQDSQMKNLSASFQQQQQAVNSYLQASQQTESAKSSLEQMQNITQTLSVQGIDTLKTIATENGLSLTAFDQMLHRANHHDPNALEEIRFLLTHAQMTGQIEPQVAQTQIQALDKNSQLAFQATESQYQAWVQDIDAHATATSGNLTVAFDHTKQDTIEALAQKPASSFHPTENQAKKDKIEAQVHVHRHAK